MRAEFYRPDDPEAVVGTATFDGRSVRIGDEEEAARDSLRRVFRATPVVVDDPSLRPISARGDVVLNPGTLEWFRAAAQGRSEREGLRVRLVPEAAGRGGWDPASAYRTFRQTVLRLEPEPTPSEARDR